MVASLKLAVVNFPVDVMSVEEADPGELSDSEAVLLSLPPPCENQRPPLAGLG